MGIVLSIFAFRLDGVCARFVGQPVGGIDGADRSRSRGEAQQAHHRHIAGQSRGQAGRPVAGAAHRLHLGEPEDRCADRQYARRNLHRNPAAIEIRRHQASQCVAQSADRGTPCRHRAKGTRDRGLSGALGPDRRQGRDRRHPGDVGASLAAGRGPRRPSGRGIATAASREPARVAQRCRHRHRSAGIGSHSKSADPGGRSSARAGRAIARVWPQPSPDCQR